MQTMLLGYTLYAPGYTTLVSIFSMNLELMGVFTIPKICPIISFERVGSELVLFASCFDQNEGTQQILFLIGFERSSAIFKKLVQSIKISNS